MIALTSIISSLVGFAGSALPTIVDIHKQKTANMHTAEMKKLDLQALEKGVALELKTYETKAADKEHERLIAHDTSMSNDSGFFGGLRKSVRPVITYMFMGLFTAMKVALIIEIVGSGDTLLAAMDVVWDPETQAIFAAVISFWFGNRAFEKKNSSSK